MKTAYTVMLVLFGLSALFSHAQDLDAAEVKSMVDSGKFVFVAQTMVPSGGNSKAVDYYYDVRVSRDSLVTYLPYSGRAYSGILHGEEGVNFTSTTFDYKAKFKKKKWEVTIKPADTKCVKELHFTIFNNGHATLLVSPFNKQQVNYYGYLKKS